MFGKARREYLERAILFLFSTESRAVVRYLGIKLVVAHVREGRRERGDGLDRMADNCCSCARASWKDHIKWLQRRQDDGNVYLVIAEMSVSQVVSFAGPLVLIKCQLTRLY